MKNNATIRNEAKRRNVRLWQIAEALGVQESFFSKKLRKELPQDEQEKILIIIDNLAKEAS